jgi:hypothetical protein
MALKLLQNERSPMSLRRKFNLAGKPIFFPRILASIGP